MRERGTVGSFIESHRAKGSHPDRRNILPQTRRIPSASHFSSRLPRLPEPSATFPANNTRRSGQSDAKTATAVKAADAADAYEHILTIQNAADLEFPATDPANAPARAEFKLGIFPPDHHVAPAAPTPTPATPKL
jgi:hypothetical protein